VTRAVRASRNRANPAHRVGEQKWGSATNVKASIVKPLVSASVNDVETAGRVVGIDNVGCQQATNVTEITHDTTVLINSDSVTEALVDPGMFLNFLRTTHKSNVLMNFLLVG